MLRACLPAATYIARPDEWAMPEGFALALDVDGVVLSMDVTLVCTTQVTFINCTTQATLMNCTTQFWRSFDAARVARLEAAMLTYKRFVSVLSCA